MGTTPLQVLLESDFLKELLEEEQTAEAGQLLFLELHLRHRGGSGIDLLLAKSHGRRV
jgi:hypothetical protein